MTKLMPQFPELTLRNYFGVWSDFDHYVTADEFTTVAIHSGSAAADDAAGGELTINPSDVTQVDNDETYVKGTKEIYKFAADKPLVFEARVKGKANTIESINLIVGVKDAVAANTLQDNGAGPPASYSGAVFYKVDGGTKWVCESSVATTQTTVTTDKTVTDNTYDTLRIEYRPVTSTVGEVHFFVDGEEVGLNTSGQQFVAHRVTFASATEMQICLGCKNGAADDSETMIVDYVGCWQKR